MLTFFTEQDQASYVEPDDRLALRKCEIGSPCLIEMVGAAGASSTLLELLRGWMQEAHERRKDREYREPAERQRLRLENMLLEDKVIKEQVAILRDSDVQNDFIKRRLWKQYRHVFGLLEAVLEDCDSGEIVDIEEIPIQGKDGGNAGR